MPDDALAPGDVVLVRFPSHDPNGHEQQGSRPAVITCIPAKSRYPVLIVAPLTTQSGPWQAQNPATYPTLPAGAANLERTSTVLLDHLRSVDMARLGAYLGTLSKSDYRAIELGLEHMCSESEA